MQQMPRLPPLPGFNFDQNIGRTKFHRSQSFDKIADGVYCLVEKSKSATHSRYPAIYAWGEIPPSPPWLSLDGQRLMFKAYFQESVHERRVPYRIRYVDISFFLEDGTMKISEPSIENSGLEQGVLVRRQRIPLPDPVKYRYYDILDLNIGTEPNIYGRVYKIISCDKFTRDFLNRMGIPVPDPIDAPTDPLYEREKKIASIKNYQKKTDTLGNFLKYDRKVLRFFGYWDDSSSLYGYVHNLEILYFLADDTIEIFEHFSGSKPKKMLVKKVKIPKFFKNLEPLGSSDPVIILNVLGENTTRGYYIPDNASSKNSATDFYKECDLTIGAQLNVFGRGVVLTDLDEFTKQYYRKKYGLDDFTPLPVPGQDPHGGKDHYKYIPPYNGFGTYEDSLSNCFKVVPRRPKVFTDKFFQYHNQDRNDTRTLRYGSQMISDIPGNNGRRFVLNVFLFDKTIAIVEVASKKGHTKSLFQKKMRIRIPGQELFTNEEPKYYEPHDFYVGANVNLNGFRFEVETADEYTFNYMEEHYKEFPKANIKLIRAKIREKLKPVYREFICKYSPFKSNDYPPVLSLSCLRDALHQYLGDLITEHEVLTVARHYPFCEKKDTRPREYIRALVHTELTRSVWNELDRVEEDVHEWDRERTGYLDRHQLYTILRACRVPLPRDLLDLLLDCIKTNEEGKLDHQDLIRFLNIKKDCAPPMVPTNVKEMYWALEEKPKDCNEIDWCTFLKDLGLENQLKELDSYDSCK